MKLTRLKDRRERALLSQQELADLVGMSRQAINAIETLRAQPQRDTIRKLAAALNVQPSELMEPER